MGQRANYVLVDANGWSLYYSHWSANTIDRDLFWGAEHALAFIQAQQPTTEWLDDVWCEGGALLDIPRRTLLLFGGEDIRYEPLRFRVWLALACQVWRGWTVRWAFEGLGDLVDHLSLPRTLVQSNRPLQVDEPETFHEVEPDQTFSVVSVRHSDGRLSLHCADRSAADVVRFPTTLVERLAVLQGHASLHLPLEGNGSPMGGVDLDVAAKRIDLWKLDDDLTLLEEVARNWPGWRFEHHYDRFESQLELTEGALVFKPPPQQQVVEEVVSSLMRVSGFNPKELLASLQKGYAGKIEDLNPHFFDYHPRELPHDERTRVLQSALAGLQRVAGFNE